MATTVDKAMAIAGLAFQAAIIGLLIWLVYKSYQCATDNSQCSTTVYSLIRTGTKYDKYTGQAPSSNVTAITDEKVTSANTCAKWCTKTYGCNGFVWNGSSCGQIVDEVKTIFMLPTSGNDTYFIQDADHPFAGFIASTAGVNYSNVASQLIGSMNLNTNAHDCAIQCFNLKDTSNCLGFSMITPTDCQLVSNISNAMTTTGVQSYVLGPLTASSYTDAKF